MKTLATHAGTKLEHSALRARLLQHSEGPPNTAGQPAEIQVLDFVSQHSTEHC